MGQRLLQQLQLLGDQFLELGREPRHVAAGMRKALHEAHRDRVDQHHEDNRNRPRRLARSLHCDGTG
jgi:hypothetical protein